MVARQAVLIDTVAYQIKLAETPEEIRSAQELRYRVFCIAITGLLRGGGSDGRSSG